MPDSASLHSAGILANAWVFGASPAPCPVKLLPGKSWARFLKASRDYFAASLGFAPDKPNVRQTQHCPAFHPQEGVAATAAEAAAQWGLSEGAWQYFGRLAFWVVS